ncbi:uncharacterized protein LOC141900577 isoform X2 [Tubulanus polymorphus]|uniref:uncharacterized protein LOC141900577 isoform X2 n=1 Tax=Tubulanus polymorphus TaxID=672921 RepID=UPI003DA539A2
MTFNMALKYREEIVGKRFLSVRSAVKLKLNRISDWEWRAGVVRAVSHKDLTNPEVSVLVEFDDRDWSRREWIKLNENIFQIFVVENSLVWVQSKQKICWPALNFKVIVDKAGLTNNKLIPVEHFEQNTRLQFVDEQDIKLFKEEDVRTLTNQDTQRAIQNWLEEQDGQKILLTTPTVLVGFRVRVYRSEGTTQWYTAVIKSYNDSTHELTVVDDTVLEEHNEDPALVQMRLIGDGVVDSILKGIDVGIAPRRRSCNSRNTSSTTSNTAAARNRGSSPINVGHYRPPRRLQVKQPQVSSKERVSERTKLKPSIKEHRKRKTETLPPLTEDTKSTLPLANKKPKSDKITVLKPEKREISPKPVDQPVFRKEKLATAKPVPVKDNKRDPPKERSSRSKKAKSVKKALLSSPVESISPDLVVDKTETVNSVQSDVPSSVSDNSGVVNVPKSEPSEPPVNNISVISQSVKKSEHRKKDSKHTNKTNNLQNKTLKSFRKKTENSKKSKHCGNSTEEAIKSVASTSTTDSCNSGVVNSDSKVEVNSESLKKDATESDSDDKAHESLVDSIVESVRRECIVQQKLKTVESESMNRNQQATSDENMHFKKLHLLSENLVKDKPLPASESLSANINVNHSVTDQIAKQFRKFNNNGSADDKRTVSISSTSSVDSLKVASEYRPVDSQGLSLTEGCTLSQHCSDTRHPERTSGTPISVSSSVHAELGEERSSSRQSVSSRASDDKRSVSVHTTEDVHRKEDTSSSPLVFDKNEPIQVYRDPELLKKDSEVRRINSLQHIMMQHHSTTHSGTAAPTAQPSSSYPTVHTPIAASHHGLTSHITASHQQSQSMLTPLHYKHQLGPMSPHMQHTLDPRGLAALQQASFGYPAAHLLQQPPQHVLSYSLPGNVTLPQLELLWQQKYPAIPVPPAWMLAQYQDELLRDIPVNLLRERAERERLEREHAERDRVERERKDREKAQLERVERERAERDREREQLERKERERAERDERERLERKRVLTESAAAAAAVNQHFKQSLQLASQKDQDTTERQAAEQKYQEGFANKLLIESQQDLLQKQTEEKRKLAIQQQHQLNHIQIQHELQQKALAEKLKSCDPKTQEAFLKTTHAYYRAQAAAVSSGHQIKQEPNFNLYGYQPYQQMYITPDKLQKHLANDRASAMVKEEKPDVKVNPEHLKVSPTSSKDSKNSVIVENKGQDSKLSLMSQESRLLHLMMHGRHPQQQQQHQQQQPQDRLRSPNSHSFATNHDSALDYKQRPDNVKVSRSQSPLHVASPQQLSAAVRQPMELQKSKSHIGNSIPTSCHSSLGSSVPTSSHVLPTIAQPPVSLPANTTAAYAYNLIQQGLVPNPMYSSASRHTADTLRTQLMGGATSTSSTLTATSAAQQAHAAAKKHRLQKEAIPRKKPKVDEPVNLVRTSAPVNSTQSIVTNTSAPTTCTVTPAVTSQTHHIAKATGFMDSFKSFVENTVHNAFLQDIETQNSRHPKFRMKNKQLDHPPSVVSTSAVATVTSPVTPTCTTDSQPSRPNSVSATSTSSLMETINRVANGIIDTDSDTLSAPSPPPHSVKSETNSTTSFSPSRSNNAPSAPKLKKAWLQRHSDEDKHSITGVDSKVIDPGNLSDSNKTSPAAVKDCYVNCSYISPTKEGESKSPISSLNGGLKDLIRREDDSTTSASEGEPQNEENGQRKRRMKTKRPSSATAKRQRSDSDSTTSTSSKLNSTGRSKLVKTNDAGEVKMDDEDTRGSSSMDLPNGKDGAGDDDAQKRRGRRKKDKEQLKKPGTGPAQPPAPVVERPLVKMTVAQLKKSLQPFLQDGSCVEVTPKLAKCRECKVIPVTKNNKKVNNSFCRFYAFRRLKYNQKGTLVMAGFSSPSDAEADDLALWAPDVNNYTQTPRLSAEVGCYIVQHVGDKFCELVEQEKEARSWAPENAEVAWKRAVQGVREMCDVCDTTLFNIHWVCHKCGFVVCLDCFKVKMQRQTSDDSTADWITCSANRQGHEPEKLVLTQIIPSTVLWDLGNLIHVVRDKYNIVSNCPCGKSKVTPKNGVSQQILSAVNHISSSSSDSKTEKPIANGIGEDHGSSKRHRKKRSSTPNSDLKTSMSYNAETASPLSILADVASMDSEKSREKQIDSDSGDKRGPNCSTLRELLTKTTKAKNDKKVNQKAMNSTLDDIIQSVVEKSLPKDHNTEFQSQTCPKLLHYKPRSGQILYGRNTPIRTYTLTETSVLFPDVPHSWLCDGRLLRLHDPQHKGNVKLFQQQWKQGQPVLVSGCHKYLDKHLWRPEAFSQEYGQLENDLVNCHNGVVIIGHPMKVFWEGFETMQKRLTDDDNEPMMLKLKDWPPTEDFRDLLPAWFSDVMQGLPLPEYTRRNGILNLASRLPDFFVKPDLGPKMYNAYGSACFPHEGTTNLHIDISDAVNIMCYVGVPNDDLKGIDHEAAALKAIDEAGCDIITKRRVREVHERPGALWHVYDAQDADKIRDLLNKVAKENGETVEPDHDPIHDQSWYLDLTLRDRLYKEYSVTGYTIIQCWGDAVFIPAGAPHQVRNLHSCIKVAEDFVSPEHLDHCFNLTQEFRQLSDAHSNHEDKLQVKNIIYHAVKEACALLISQKDDTDKDKDDMDEDDTDENIKQEENMEQN